ncbi:MAG TPA: sugar-binding domain-containing protein, partial [Chloroflexota bacterium]|nr:sugar-binding domain-containing protein [Chloroflexota bacterium]
AVARMYYLDQLGQQEIAEIMGISRSQISRLLTRAREMGVVRISVDEYDPCDRELERALRERLGVRRAVVVRTAGAVDRRAEPVRRTIGYFAAPAVAERLRPGMVVGLAGGRTLAALVAHVRVEGGAAHAPAARVVPLMGNIGPTSSEIDAMELSRTLAQRLGGTLYTLNAPAIAQDREARDLFLAHEHIRAVRELFGALGLALVGVGSLEESAFIDRGVLPPADLARLRDAGAVGEICGRFFDAAGRECASAYRDRVVSIGLDELRRCDEVVAVTNGARRGAAVRAALKGGLVGSLVIDDVGARAVLDEGGRAA